MHGRAKLPRAPLSRFSTFGKNMENLNVCHSKTAGSLKPQRSTDVRAGNFLCCDKDLVAEGQSRRQGKCHLHRRGGDGGGKCFIWCFRSSPGLGKNVLRILMAQETTHRQITIPGTLSNLCKRTRWKSLKIKERTCTHYFFI